MAGIRNLLIIAASILLALTVVEGGLRLAFPIKVEERKITVWDHSDPILPRHADGVLFYSATMSHPTFTDSGFRLVKNNCLDAHASRILVVGDSNIAALFVDDGDDLASQLALILNRQGCYQVKSFGVSGFGPDQSILAIERFAEHESFDFVVLHAFADNDAGDVIRNNHELAESGLSDNLGYCFLRNGWADHFLLAAAVKKAVFITTGDYLVWEKEHHSLGRDELCRTVFDSPGKTLFEVLMKRAEMDRQILREGRMQLYIADRYDIEFACNPNAPLRDFVDTKMAAIADKFSDLSNLYSFKPLLLIEPSEYDMTTNNAELTSAMKSECENYSPDNLVNVFLDGFRDKALIVNLSARFKGCNECYFSEEELSGDNHWNQLGIRISAEEIARSILQYDVNTRLP